MMFDVYIFLTVCLYVTSVQGYNYIERGGLCQTANGKFGTCVHFNDCPSAIEEVRQGGRPLICEFDGLFPIVCCLDNNSNQLQDKSSLGSAATNETVTVAPAVADTTITVTTTTVASNTPEEPPSNVPPKDRKEGVENDTDYVPFDEANLSLWKCGEYHSRQRNISDDFSQYEHVALLGYVEDLGKNKIISWKCIGSLISDKFVLTTARCAKPQRIGALKYVQLGRLDINSNGAEVQDFRVKATYIHPDFQYFSIYDDIGLIELNKPVKFTKYVRPACLPVTRNINSTPLETAGYGLIQAGHKLSSSRMRYGSTVNCKQTYDTNMKEGNRLICTEGISDENGRCNIDIGGPLHFQNKVYDFGGFSEIVGIYLFGSLCQMSGDIFMQVAPYISWIEKIVWPNS